MASHPAKSRGYFADEHRHQCKVYRSRRETIDEVKFLINAEYEIGGYSHHSM